MLRRSLFAALSAFLLLAALATSAFAWSGDLESAPALTHESPAGYYLWHDDAGLHLRTHGPDADHDFTARLHTDGVFTDLSSVRLESADAFQVLDGGHTLVLRFHTYDATDGVNFRIRGGTRLRLALGLDGSLIAPESIFLGAAGSHPADNPFTLYR